MYLDDDIGLVGAESDLDRLEFILRVLTLVLLENVLSIEARNVALDQLEAVELVVVSLSCLLEVLEAPVREDLVDLLLLVRCLVLDVQVKVHQELSANLSHSLHFTLYRYRPQRVQSC